MENGETRPNHKDQNIEARLEQDLNAKLKQELSRLEEELKTKFLSEIRKFEAEREKLASENKKLHEKLSTLPTNDQPGSTARLVALEREVETLQESLAKQSKDYLSEIAALEKRLQEASEGHQLTGKSLADAQQETARRITELHSHLESAQSAHDKLAADLAEERAKQKPIPDFESTTASIQSKLEEYVVTAVNSALDRREYSGPTRNSGESLDGVDLRRQVVAILRGLYETRTGGVDWLLEINGARVEHASPSFINSPFIYGAVRWLFPGLQVRRDVPLARAADSRGRGIYGAVRAGGPSDAAATRGGGGRGALGGRGGHGRDGAWAVLGDGGRRRLRADTADPARQAAQADSAGRPPPALPTLLALNLPPARRRFTAGDRLQADVKRGRGSTSRCGPR